MTKALQDAAFKAVMVKTVWDLLGVKPPVTAQATSDLFDAREYLYKTGLPFSAVTRFGRAFHVSLANEVPDILGIPYRTLVRRKATGTLHFNESVTVFIAAELFQEAVAVFGGPAAAVEWFKTPNGAIRDERPLNLISDDIGRKIVEDLLGRIRHGIYE